MDASRDTILALASGPLPSALAVIRVSGPETPHLIERHLLPGQLVARRATLVSVIDAGSGAMLDQAIAVYYPAGASFTGEESLELTVHGGRAVVESVLSAFRANRNVRLAEPGEFTKRALLAGKLDLIEAESIADLVDAETEAQRAQALSRLMGSASMQFTQWHDALLECLALLEAVIDFPDEEDAPRSVLAPVSRQLDWLVVEIGRALADEGLGEKVRSGFSVVILGAPNVGKSSLLNRLAGRDVAIVTDIAGTTRDLVEVRLDLGGYLVRLSDTAGLRETTDPVELEGIRRARVAAEAADLVIGVLDATRPDEASWAPDGICPDLVVINKSDLVELPTNVSRETFALSAQAGVGIDRLIERLTQDIARRAPVSGQALITRARHRDALEKALARLNGARDLLRHALGAELVAEDVRAASTALGRLLGRIEVEDVLGAVFSRFCIGK